MSLYALKMEASKLYHVINMYLYRLFFLPQGFPDFAPPSHVVEALGHVTSYSNHMIHHYTRAAVC